MFGKAKNTKFTDKVNACKYDCLYRTMLDILSSEVKTSAVDGTAVVDYGATCAEIKQRACIALNFVDNLVKNDDCEIKVVRNKQSKQVKQGGKK